MEYIISYLTESIAKKIFGNKNFAIEFLKELNKTVTIPELNILTKQTNSKLIWDLIIKYWNYEEAKKIIRKIFRTTAKYKNGKDADKALDVLVEEWNKLNLGQLEWPCSQGDFDGFVQRINNMNLSGYEKDERVKIAAIKYRRLKEINTYRNDFIETLIFEKNDNIIPTLKHSQGIDFYINGISYDQKVAKSPTRQFIRDFGENWKSYALKHPQKVAEYLYKYQDEGRFDSNPRLLIVYLDEDINSFEIRNTINKIDLSTPLDITFTFKHKHFGEKSYKTNCFIILLTKNLYEYTKNNCS